MPDGDSHCEHSEYPLPPSPSFAKAVIASIWAIRSTLKLRMHCQTRASHATQAPLLPFPEDSMLQLLLPPIRWDAKPTGPGLVTRNACYDRLCLSVDFRPKSMHSVRGHGLFHRRFLLFSGVRCVLPILLPALPALQQHPGLQPADQEQGAWHPWQEGPIAEHQESRLPRTEDCDVGELSCIKKAGSLCQSLASDYPVCAPSCLSKVR